MELLKRLGSFFLDILEVVIFAISLFLFVYLLVLQPHKIKGLSMYPNFEDAEYLLTDKISYRFNLPQRGDVVVFKAPLDPNEEYIKRIIGLPGENVSLNDGKISINGEIINETYLPDNLYTDGGQFLPSGSSVIVPQDQYFVLGDNRPHSSDSRSWGFVKTKAITGKAWFVYWPVKLLGTIPKITYAGI